MLELSGDTAAVGWGLNWGLAGKPGGDLVFTSGALIGKCRRIVSGDSTGDCSPAATFCSKTFVGVEQSDGIEAGVELEDVGWDDLDGVLASSESAAESQTSSPRSNAFILTPATQCVSK